MRYGDHCRTVSFINFFVIALWAFFLLSCAFSCLALSCMTRHLCDCHAVIVLC